MLHDVLTNTEILFRFPKPIWHDYQARHRESGKIEKYKNGGEAKEVRRKTWVCEHAIDAEGPHEKRKGRESRRKGDKKTSRQTRKRNAKGRFLPGFPTDIPQGKC